MAKQKEITCADCYFKQNMLCALKLTGPCTTFRSAAHGLRPERQLSFVFRTPRAKSAHAFPQPGTRCG